MILAVYSAVALLALGYILWACEDFRLIYLVLGVVLALMLIYLPFGDLRTALLAALLLVTLVVPAVRLIWRDLRSIAGQLGQRRLGWLTLRSLLLWLPIALVVTGSFAFVSWRNAAVQAEVYGIEVPASWAGACANLVCEGDGPDMRRDLHAATDRLSVTTRAKVGARLGAALEKINATSGDASDALRMALFDPNEGVFPDTFVEFTGIDIPDCSWLLAIVWPPEMANCMRRMVLQPMANAYVRMRSDLQREISTRYDDLAARLDNGTNELEREIMTALERDLDRYAGAAKNGIDRAFLMGWVLAVLSWISITMVLTKTFFVILARFVFDCRTGGVPLSIAGARPVNGAMNGKDITRTDGAFGYRVQLNGQRWYGSFGRRVRPDEHGRPTFPMPRRLFFRRLVSAKLRMQRFDPQQFDHIGGQSDHSTRFVQVDLREGDQLCFQLSNLAAFSEGIAFRSVLNLKLAAMLQHRMFFPVAYGVGSVVLRVDGGSMRVMPHDPPEGTDPMDMAAFDINGSFALRAQHDFISVYTEGYTILPDERTFVIRHAPERLASHGGKLLRKALFYVLPI